MKENQNHMSALITLITVFFFWGFIAASNGVFIPFCKEYFNLSQFQSQLIDSAFYGAYYIGGLFLFLISNFGIPNPWNFRPAGRPAFFTTNYYYLPYTLYKPRFKPI